MGFLHEIKNRITLVLFSWCFTFSLTYSYKEILWFILTKSTVLTTKFYFVYTTVMETFTVYFQLSHFFSIQVSFFYLLFNAFSFFSCAFYRKEFFLIKKSLILSGIVLITGSLVIICLIFPNLWFFFASFQELALIHSLHFVTVQ